MQIRAIKPSCSTTSMRVLPRYTKCFLLFFLLLIPLYLLITDFFQRFSKINVLPLSLHCNPGRLGNQMCTYATLYGLSSLNHRDFNSLSCNIDKLKDIFVGPSRVQGMKSSDYTILNPWNITSYMRPEDTDIPLNSNFLSGYKHPCSYTFFDHVRDDIRREFQFHEHYTRYAQTVLHRANFKQLPNATFVGVHVRRGDYKKHWLDAFEGLPVNMKYFQQALRYFREKYKNVVFVGVSDDRMWCRKKLSDRFGVYVPEEAPSPGHDLAILANCNHTVMTYGTFGFWGSYLAGGEVLYFDKFLKPNTSFTLNRFLFDKMYLPNWIGIITVNVSEWFSAADSDEGKKYYHV